MRALLLLLLEPKALYSTYPWDDAGHLPVAEIAYDRFSSALQPKLQGALAGLTECSHTYGAIISAACYMDDLCRFKHSSYLALTEGPNANSVTLSSAYAVNRFQHLEAGRGIGRPAPPLILGTSLMATWRNGI